MALADIIRMVIPSRLRIAVGIWAINLASHREIILRVFLTVLYGKTPGKIGLTKTHSYYDYKGHRILAEKHDAGVFLEIFQAEVYEQIWHPHLGDVVIDIGAYVGMFTVKASEAVGCAGQVIAIEPCPESFRLLKTNTDGYLNVRLIKAAIMNEIGMGKLYYSKAKAANSLIKQSNKYIEVETMTLDWLLKSLQLSRVDFIKIDAEGAELEVLKGATETLAKGTRLVIAAYHTAKDGKREIGEVAKYLQDIGYKIIYKKGLRSYINAEKE